MDFELSEELRMLRDMVRSFVDRELIPLEKTLGPTRELPDETLQTLQAKTRELGLWMLDVPEEYGGAGLGLLARCVIAEEIGRTAAVPFRAHGLFGPEVRPVLFRSNEDQRERFLMPVLRGEKRICFAQSEPDAGSDPGSMRTRAIEDGDDYIINGTKLWITGAAQADFAQVMAVTDPAKGSHGGITCFIVDLTSDGVSREELWPLMIGETPWQIVFNDVRVPKANIMGDVGGGFGLGQRWLLEGRIRGHGARPLGIAERALQMMIDHANERVTFGKPLSERQAIQFMIADSAMELRAARLLVYECAWRMERGEDVRDLSFMVKITSVEMASRVVDRSMQVHGAMGLSTELPLEWWYRQLRSLRITEGAPEILRWRLGKSLAVARRPS